MVIVNACGCLHDILNVYDESKSIKRVTLFWGQQGSTFQWFSCSEVLVLHSAGGLLSCD